VFCLGIRTHDRSQGSLCPAPLTPGAVAGSRPASLKTRCVFRALGLPRGGRRLPPGLAENAVRFPGARPPSSPPTTLLEPARFAGSCAFCRGSEPTTRSRRFLCPAPLTPGAVAGSRPASLAACHWHPARALGLPRGGRRLPPGLAENAVRFPGARFAQGRSQAPARSR
jgi:hypothetical protein